MAQPAIKCRGREYLRIIYGPEYADPAKIERLRSRHSGARGHSHSESSVSGSRGSTDSSGRAAPAGPRMSLSLSSPWRASPSTRDCRSWVPGNGDL